MYQCSGTGLVSPQTARGMLDVSQLDQLADPSSSRPGILRLSKTGRVRHTLKLGGVPDMTLVVRADLLDFLIALDEVRSWHSNILTGTADRTGRLIHWQRPCVSGSVPQVREGHGAAVYLLEVSDQPLLVVASRLAPGDAVPGD